jgi:hypothetical protein
MTVLRSLLLVTRYLPTVILVAIIGASLLVALYVDRHR